MRRGLAFISVALGLACDGGEAPKPEATAAEAAKPEDPAPSETPKPEAKPEAQPDAKPDAKPDSNKIPEIPHARTKPSPKQIDEAKARANTFQTHLDAGRKASKAKDFDEAFAQLGKARELRPNDASVLGELGYASYKAGKLDDALRWTEDATNRTEDSRKLGALFYNLGLIAEAKGDPALAKLHYELSLVHRDNATVEAKLAGLATVPPPKGPDTLEAWCAAETKKLDCLSEGEVEAIDAVEESIDYDYWCGCDIQVRAKSGSPEGSIREAAVVNLGFSESGYVIEYESVLVVRTAEGGWQPAHAELNSWMREFVDSDTDDGEVGPIEFRDVSPAPGLELVASWRDFNNDLPEMLSDETDEIDTSRRGTVVCGGATPTCVSWPTRVEIVRGEFQDWEMQNPVTTTSVLNESFDPKTGLTLSLESGEGKHEGWEGLIGTHGFDTLFSARIFHPKRLR